MIAVKTEIEPPGLAAEDDDGPPQLVVYCALQEGDDTSRIGFAGLDVDADDDTIAAAMVECMIGAAAMRGPQLLEAPRRRIRSGAAS